MGSRLPAALALSAALAAGAAFVATEIRRHNPVPERPPDIVVLLWDTTRADRLTPWGHRRDTSPWLASVAARGVVFEQCRAPAPWTLPSHASLFTGLLPTHHGAVALQAPLPSYLETLAERLREEGYDTVLLSNNPIVGPATGLDQGFTSIHKAWERGADAETTLALLDGELAERKADPARARKPLFLFVNLMEPHLPYDPPDFIERPWRPAGSTEDQVRAARAFRNPLEMLHNLGIRPAAPAVLGLLPGLYDGEIRDLDAHCARMEKSLEEAGVLGRAPDGTERPAILVVTSDHGENLGEHGLLDHKMSLSEQVLRVPLVIRWPGRFDGGRRVADPVRLQDLFPTLLEAAGAPFPPRPHAASLLTAPLEGRFQVAVFPPPLPFLEEMRRLAPDATEEKLLPFRTGRVAAVEATAGGRLLKWERRTRTEIGSAPVVLGESLFDLSVDPGEERDLLAVPSPAPGDVGQARSMASRADDWVRVGR